LFGDYPEIKLKEKQRALFLGSSNMFTDSGPAATFETSKHRTQDKGWVSYALIENNLLIRIDKPKKLNKRFSSQIYLFGYNDKIPFASMPKIRIVTRYKKFKVFNGRKMIKPQGITLALNPKKFILKVPLQILGEPDFILALVKTYSGVLHVDTTSFRKINIE